MDKIAFVVVRYGNDINGGAELHCRMLAERLIDSYQVEVLTTCVKDYISGVNEYAVGEELINNVLVRRFKTNPIDREKNLWFIRKSKIAGKMRKFLYKYHLLSVISTLFPIWRYKQKYELKVLNSDVFYSSSLYSFIHDHKEDYKAIIPISLDYPHLYYTALYAPEKTIVIPTMHYHVISFRSILTSIFTKVAYVGFNTTAEEKLAEHIFGPRIAPHGIISVGIDIAKAADWEQTSLKYQLPQEYLLYVGRVTRNKLDYIFKYFLNYKQLYKDSNLKLVMVGGLFGISFHHPDIVYTGFVDESEKTTIIEHAKLVINPSKHESLSLILLEAMSLGKAVLVNGECAVMKEHAEKSGYAALPYVGQKGFNSQLRRLETSVELREAMGKKGKLYVLENYNWDLILGRMRKVIDRI